MTVSADTWQARAALCELLALSFRYEEGDVLTQAVVSGEWADAADEITAALGIDWNYDAAPSASEMASEADIEVFQKELRLEATRLFVGFPKAVCSPYEGIFRSKIEGTEALMYVNSHTMAVVHFCKACGLGHSEGTNEPLDAVWIELELLEHLALRSAEEVMLAEADDVVSSVQEGKSIRASSATLPGGSPEAAYDQFMSDHVRSWIPQFADALLRESRIPFYRVVASLLAAFVQ